MLGLPESLGNAAAFSQRRLYNDVPTCETLTFKYIMVKSCHEAALALGEASEKCGGNDKKKEVVSPAATYAQAVVSLEAVRSYFHAKDNHSAHKSAVFRKGGLALKWPQHAGVDRHAHVKKGD